LESISVKNFVTTGSVAGVLAFMAVIAGAFGKPALASFFNDPTTAANVATLLGSALTLYAGMAQGLRKDQK
jgi:hypothetical protein